MCVCGDTQKTVNGCGAVHARISIDMNLVATSCAANIAAYGDDSSLSAFTFIPPVTLVMVSRLDRSVTC